jgi:hypothetical protein
MVGKNKETAHVPRRQNARRSSFRLWVSQLPAEVVIPAIPSRAPDCIGDLQCNARHSLRFREWEPAPRMGIHAASALIGTGF